MAILSTLCSGCGFYQFFWIFCLGAFGGDIAETLFCRWRTGKWMSRSSVVWGPFSIVWGGSIAAATVLLFQYKDNSAFSLFVIGSVFGGIWEYLCSIFTERAFGKVFWDYSKMQFNLNGRINLLYCFFWGIAAVIWFKCLYPPVSGWIEKMLSDIIGTCITWIMIVFMTCNMLVSCLALVRSAERTKGMPAVCAWQKTMDKYFDDEKLCRIYPNAINVTASQGSMAVENSGLDGASSTQT